MQKSLDTSFIILFVCFISFSNNIFGQNKQAISAFDSLLPKVTPIPVTFLGSYHMSNPGADAFNLESDDVTVPKRQEEIKEVVKLLSRFNPTKIVIEAPWGDSSTIDRYQKFLKGELIPRKAEEEQIGFRLAKLLGHNTIYPIDVKMNLDDTELSKLIQSNPSKFGPYLSILEKAGNGAINIMGEWLSNGTIREMLYQMNNPEIEQIAHEIYFRSFVPIVADDSYAGADMVNTWYHRNLRIFSNLHKICDQENDRILVIYGQGHVPLLKQFTRDSPYFEVIEVQPFLKE